MGALDDASRATLYRLASERGVRGRSTMSHDELLQALQDGDGSANGAGRGGGSTDDGSADRGTDRADDDATGSAGSDTGADVGADAAADEPEDDGPRSPETASRVDAFTRLAQAAARGDLVMLPRALRGEDRRLHVRQTLREDHETRIADHREDAMAKFDKLAGSLFSFFRGTCLLFYRDCAGMDAWMPTVLTLGDVHPENFGVMPSADNVPIFGVNDFDEAYYAPFTWDLKRGATGFMIAAKEEGGKGRKGRCRIARHFVRGYVDGIRRYASENTETRHQLRIDNAPKIIRKLIEGALEERDEWLLDDYHDEHRRGFRASEKLVPVTSRREEFQQLLARHVEKNNIPVPTRAGELRVKDVAERKGQGTASLGLSRYYLLVEGPAADGTDDLVIEVKRARRSALAGLVPPSRYDGGGQGDRIAHAHSVQLVRGDVFYGSIEHDGLSWMVRERAPFREDIDLDDLSGKQWRRYAAVCGETLAHAHALSDEVGQIEYDVEPAIVEAIGHPDLFVDDVVRWAEEATDRIRRDHACFQADHALGAFRSVDVVYR